MQLAPYSAGMPQMMMDPRLADPRMAQLAAMNQAQLAMVAPQAVPMPQAQNPMMAPQALGMPQGQIAPQQAMGQLPMPTGGAQAQMAVAGMKQGGSFGTILKSVLATGAMGAALGAGLTFLPFIPGGPITGALVGGAAGAVIGIIRGIGKSRQQAQQMAMAGIQPGATPDPAMVAAAARPARPRRRRAAARVKVRRGDTLAKIAARHKVSVKALHAANRAKIGANPSRLRAGITLEIPR